MEWRRITVHITVRHISKGQRCSWTEGPVALAMNDATGLEWSVGYPDMGILGDRSFSIPCPLVVQDFYEAFEKNSYVRPISFEITAPVINAKAKPQ